jgi:hypothetical protein
MPSISESTSLDQRRAVVIGSDFGVPASAGEQARKIILLEAVRLGERSYAIEPTGRNERLVRPVEAGLPWKQNRRGWTVPELAESLANDHSVAVSTFDFPFSIPVSLLSDTGFAQALGQTTFRTRSTWAQYVGDNLRLEFASDKAGAKLDDLDRFQGWRDKRFWKRRKTDEATGGSPPLKHKFQNVFAMTLAGTALLVRLAGGGHALALSTTAFPPGGRVVFETYPAAVAAAVGFAGSYKQQPQECLGRAERYLADQGISLAFDRSVRKFCVKYRTRGKSRDDRDPDGADAFLCLVASICFREGMARLCDGDAGHQTLEEEGCIIAPQPAG